MAKRYRGPTQPYNSEAYSDGRGGFYYLPARKRGGGLQPKVGDYITPRERRLGGPVAMGRSGSVSRIPNVRTTREGYVPGVAGQSAPFSSQSPRSSTGSSAAGRYLGGVAGSIGNFLGGIGRSAQGISDKFQGYDTSRLSQPAPQAAPQQSYRTPARRYNDAANGAPYDATQLVNSRGGNLSYNAASERDRLLRRADSNQQFQEARLIDLYKQGLDLSQNSPARQAAQADALDELKNPGMTPGEEQIIKNRLADLSAKRELVDRRTAREDSGQRGTLGPNLTGLESEAAGRRTSSLLNAEGNVSIAALQSRRNERLRARNSLLRLSNMDQQDFGRWASGVAGAIRGTNPNYEFEQERGPLQDVIASAADPGNPDNTASLKMLAYISKQSGDPELNSIIRQLGL